jgi:hypothetical protein
MTLNKLLVSALFVAMSGSGLGAVESRGPELLAPPDGAAMTLEAAHKAPVTFSWRAPNGAATYRLRIATTSDFKRPSVDRTTGRTSETVHGLESGRYFWVVTALDAAGRDVFASPTGAFSLQYQ